MPITRCRQCKKEIVRKGKPGIFCSVKCKSEHQTGSHGYTVEWLREQYVTMGMSTYAIAKIVKRDPKRVWQWLQSAGIATRSRGWKTVQDHESRPYQSRAWLWTEYHVKQRSTEEIAKQFGVVSQNVLYFLQKHGIKRRTTVETRAIKKWGLSGEVNGMFGVRGEDHPNWKGGCTPERQACYASKEWRMAARAVRKRDKNTCQRCGAEGVPTEIHHIVGFACVELRTVVDNLVLLCVGCHDFVHGKANVNKEFIGHA